jgi:putative hydrolase of HD superfamily
MTNFLDEMLGGEGNREARERFRGLWDVSWRAGAASGERCGAVIQNADVQEYEARETPESKLVKVS